MTMEDIFKTMQDLIAEQFAIDADEISMDSSFVDDLGADSVDLVELVMAMEEEFNVGEIDEDDLTGLKTVGDCDNLSEDGYLYPQFNNAEDLKKLNRSYIPDMEAYLAAGGTLTEQQQAVYDKALAVKVNTVNDPEKQEALFAAGVTAVYTDNISE